MRTLLWLATVCGAVVLAVGMAVAAPSHLGPTGIVGTPTADVVGARHYDVALDYAKWDVFGDDFKAMPIRLVAGVSDKVEVGIGYTKWKNFSELKVTPVNVKAVLMPESETAPAVAVGAAYGKLKETGFPAIKVTTLYAVATKTLSMGADEYGGGGMTGTLRGSLGVMYNKYKDTGLSDSATEPFISVEYTTADAKTTFAVEYKTSEGISGLSDDALMSFVARHMFMPNLWGQVGLTNVWYTVPNPDDGDKEWFIGVGYRWAPPAEEAWY